MIDLERLEGLQETNWQPEQGYFIEPSAGRTEDYRPWEATPVDLKEFHVSNHQQDVETLTFGMLAGGTYPYMTPQLQEYLDLVYFSREANRRTKNAQSYGASLTDGVISPDEIDPVYFQTANQRTLTGRARPGEIHDVRKARKMAAAELAKLTHILGYRLEYIDAMRAEVCADIEQRGGVIYDSPEQEYEIIAADNGVTRSNKLDFALTMTRKRHIASIDGAKVVERSSFIVVLNNQTRLDPLLIKKLKSVDVNGPPEDEAGNPTRWVRMMMMDGQLVAEVRQHLEANDFETIIPMSTTIFEYDSNLRKMIEEKRRLEQPDTSDLVKQAREAFLRSVGGIAYVNSSEKK